MPAAAIVPALETGLGRVAFSTLYDVRHHALHRVNQVGFHGQSDGSWSPHDHAGAWCAREVNSKSDWAQVTFDVPVRVHRVDLQGRSDADRWVKEVEIDTSDLQTADANGGAVWHAVLGANGHRRIAANSDRNTIVRIPVDGAVEGGRVARSVRISPKDAYGWTCMRFEVWVSLVPQPAYSIGAFEVILLVLFVVSIFVVRRWYGVWESQQQRLAQRQQDVL